MIEIKDIYKSYKQGDRLVPALKGLSFSLGRGEFAAVMGPSGSGKTTFLNILGCLDVPEKGSYIFRGQDISRMDSNSLAEMRNKNIGYIFQSFYLLEHLTALENVELPMAYAGIKRRQRREMAVEALCGVGLKHRLNHRPSQLSGGQRQRVAIARALINRPALILADEPTGNLDENSGVEIMEMIKELNSTGAAVVLITHDPKTALYADRRYILSDGVLREG
ncbi:MAG TPA: ABC transporter ATP-binding protein [Firmicutes bacterium]|nr:ABC transporter ATP-binding protein [Bacillota bacterium]